MTIYDSPFAPLPIPDLSITDYVMQAVRDRTEPVMTCGITGRAYTGPELMQAVAALAGGLTSRGLGAGHTVALMAPNIPEFAIVFHAVAYAGGTITTINPTCKADEVRHQLRDARAKYLITVPAILDVAQEGITGTGVSGIAVVGEADGAEPLLSLMGPPQSAQVPVDLDAHTVVLPYSSGTTGLPKGVRLNHRNLVANLVQLGPAIPVQPREVALAILPYFHIYGMQVMMNYYLARGASVVTLPRFELDRFLQLSADHRTERMFVVPPVMIALARHPSVDDHDLSALRMVMSAAAPMGGDLSEAVRMRLGCDVIQGYGMTELSPVTHACPPGRNVPGASGVLLPMTQARLVDSGTGADAAPGEPGELWCRGPQVMQGYLNNAEATAQTIDTDGWLHTGDIATIDADGYMFIVDRLKELIKYNGFQVPPAELEALLITHPDVADVAVLGQPDEAAGELPVAFVVTVPGRTLDAEALMAFVAEQVTGYKRIHRVIAIDAIPKSASGKILRRLLRPHLTA